MNPPLNSSNPSVKDPIRRPGVRDSQFRRAIPAAVPRKVDSLTDSRAPDRRASRAPDRTVPASPMGRKDTKAHPDHKAGLHVRRTRARRCRVDRARHSNMDPGRRSNTGRDRPGSNILSTLGTTRTGQGRRAARRSKVRSTAVRRSRASPRCLRDLVARRDRVFRKDPVLRRRVSLARVFRSRRGSRDQVSLVRLSGKPSTPSPQPVPPRSRRRSPR